MTERELEALFARGLHPGSGSRLGRAWRTDGVTGFVSKTRSPESLADCMLRMIQLPAAERRAMGLRARNHAEEHFGVERVCRAYLSALEELGIGPARSGWTNAVRARVGLAGGR